ncbi:MAG: TadE family protein [Thiohalomonadales bacterium]
MNRKSQKKLSFKPHKQAGASITELLVVMLAMAPLVLGAIQMAMFYHAKSIINYATFEAARAGAVAGANIGPMKSAFERNILPLYGSGVTVTSIMKARAKAKADAWAPTIPTKSFGAGGKIQILSPTKEAFRDFGMRINGGALFIPNDHLRYRATATGGTSKVNVQDANLLKIKVTYGYKMIVPVINKIIARIMMLADKKNINYYLGDPPRLPIVSYVTVRMQSNTIFNSKNFPSLKDPAL